MDDSLRISIASKAYSSGFQNPPNIVTIEAQPIISTCSIDHISKYRDLGTIVYIWGENPADDDKRTVSADSDKEPWRPSIYKKLRDVRILELVCSDNVVYFLSGFHSLYVLGKGEYGQLGLGPSITSVAEPTMVESLNSVKQVACGNYHSLALTQDGRLYSWGRNDFSGHVHGTCTFSPGEILTNDSDTGAPRRICKVIAASNTQSVAACDGGTSLYTWGISFVGEHHFTPVLFHSFCQDRIQQLCIGKKFALALSECGSLITWGDGTFGEVLAKPAYIRQTMIPTLFKHKDLKDIVSIKVGDRHALMVDKNGKLWAMGENIYGQCGPVDKRGGPHLIDLASDFVANKIACGPRNSACINTGNQLYTWGHSENSKLVFTATVDALVQPQRQPGVAVSSGLKNACTMPRLIYSLLHEKVTNVGFANRYTVIITGDGMVRRNTMQDYKL